MALLRGCLFVLFTVIPIAPRVVSAASDPCVKIGGKTFASPADVLACEKSFPFNETLRQNVLTNIARVFDFFTFENYYLNSPPPFQESTAHIRQSLTRINNTKYDVSAQKSNWSWMNEFGRRIMILIRNSMILLPSWTTVIRVRGKINFLNP